MAASLEEMIAQLEAEGADPRLAMPSRASITKNYSGFTSRFVLALLGFSVVAAMIVTTCVLYVMERDELGVGRTVMNAGVDVTHMPPTELVARLTVDSKTAAIIAAVVNPTPAASSHFDDLFHLLDRPGSPIVDVGRVRMLHDFMGWLSRQDRPVAALDNVLEEALVADDPRMRLIFAFARQGEIPIDRIADILKFAKDRPGVIDDMLAIAVKNDADVLLMRWVAAHPDADRDPVRWIVTKLATDDPFASRVIGAMGAKNPALIKLIDALPSDCSTRYLDGCKGEKNGK
jgi:hypothetical protein